MKTAAYVVIFGFLLPLTSSQSTLDDNDSDGHLQQHDELVELLQNQFIATQNKLSQLEALLSQLDSKQNLTESPGILFLVR